MLITTDKKHVLWFTITTINKTIATWWGENCPDAATVYLSDETVGSSCQRCPVKEENKVAQEAAGRVPMTRRKRNSRCRLFLLLTASTGGFFRSPKTSQG